jgi:hypothetical protein
LDIEAEPVTLPESVVAPPGVVVVSGAVEPMAVEPAVPAAPIDVPLPVLDASVLPEAMLEPVLPDGVVVALASALVDGVVGTLDTPEPVVLDVVDEVDVSVALWSPQAARERAAIMARAAQRARGVALIIGKLLQRLIES